LNTALPIALTPASPSGKPARAAKISSLMLLTTLPPRRIIGEQFEGVN
jgi:hypothetical protein